MVLTEKKRKIVLSSFVLLYLCVLVLYVIRWDNISKDTVLRIINKTSAPGNTLKGLILFLYISAGVAVYIVRESLIKKESYGAAGHNTKLFTDKWFTVFTVEIILASVFSAFSFSLPYLYLRNISSALTIGALAVILVSAVLLFIEFKKKQGIFTAENSGREKEEFTREESMRNLRTFIIKIILLIFVPFFSITATLDSIAMKKEVEQNEIVTKTNFDRIKTGMTEDELNSILGSTETTLWGTEDNGDSIETRIYYGPLQYKSIKVVLKNGRVSLKNWKVEDSVQNP